MDHVNSTSIINPILEQIGNTVSAGNHAGLNIGTSTEGNFFCVICLQENINRTIDLEEDGAMFKLNALHTELKAIIPSTHIMQGAH